VTNSKKQQKKTPTIKTVTNSKKNANENKAKKEHDILLNQLKTSDLFRRANYF